MRTCWLLFFFFGSLLQAQNASIEGTTVHSIDGQPLGGVHVTVFAVASNTGPTAIYGVISDKSGHFTIPSIAPGTYLYRGQLSGFLSTLKVPGSIPFPTIALKAGEHIPDLRVEMTPLSVIGGRVLDERGQPVSGLHVDVESALPLRALSAPPLSAMQTTDDRGEFRYIVGPGKYKLKVSSPQANNNSAEIRDGVRQMEYPTMYYPGVADVERASIVEVGPGDAVTGLAIHLSRQQGITLSGVVSGIPSKAQSTMVHLRFGPDANTFEGTKSVLVSSDGQFQFAGLPAKFYTISAYSRVDDLELVSPVISQRVESDSTFDLALNAGFELPGKLVFPPSMANPAAKLRLAGDAFFGATADTASADVEKDGGFRLRKVYPGKYHVKISPLPDNAYVSAIAIDGRPVAGEQLDLDSDIARSQLKITLAADGAVITGHILDKDGEQITGSVGAAFLLKNKDELNDDRNMSQIKADGTYRFKGVRPGKYLLFAFDYVRFGVETSLTSMMRMAMKSAVEVELKPNDILTMDVRAAVRETNNAKP